jgi:hypothetical protein
MMNSSQKIVLKLGISLCAICILFFLVSQREERISFEFTPALDQRVLSMITADSANDLHSHSMNRQGENLGFEEESGQAELSVDSVTNGNILLIGDSQLEGLRLPVYNYCKWNNLKLVASVVWYGSTTKQWGSTDTLSNLLRKYKPSLVIIALGLNELFVKDFEKRKEYINTIKSTLSAAATRYYWIGPAAWKQDDGIVALLAEMNGNHFFDSSKLVLERSSDGRHPSKDAAWIWMDAVSKDISAKGILNLLSTGERSAKCEGSPFILISK